MFLTSTILSSSTTDVSILFAIFSLNSYLYLIPLVFNKSSLLPDSTILSFWSFTTNFKLSDETTTLNVLTASPAFDLTVITAFPIPTASSSHSVTPSFSSTLQTFTTDSSSLVYDILSSYPLGTSSWYDNVAVIFVLSNKVISTFPLFAISLLFSSLTDDIVPGITL